MSEKVYAGAHKIKKNFLFYHDHHFDTVNGLPAFFSRAFFLRRVLKIIS
jgi:hypothetical protein